MIARLGISIDPVGLEMNPGFCNLDPSSRHKYCEYREHARGGETMKKAHAEDRSIIALSALTLIILAACWAICLL
jgi:hypothetical protein